MWYKNVLIVFFKIYVLLQIHPLNNFSSSPSILSITINLYDKIIHYLVWQHSADQTNKSSKRQQSIITNSGNQTNNVYPLSHPVFQVHSVIRRAIILVRLLQNVYSFTFISYYIILKYKIGLCHNLKPHLDVKMYVLKFNMYKTFNMIIVIHNRVNYFKRLKFMVHLL